MKWLFRMYIEQGKQEMLSQVISKFESMYDDYYGQGEFESANLVVDIVAYIQEDHEGMTKPAGVKEP